MKYLYLALSFLYAFLWISSQAQQKLSRTDKKTILDLKRHLSILAHDSMEGRRAGTEGEKKASTYIASQFHAFGLQPKGTHGTYFQPFEIQEGLRLSHSSYLQINGHILKSNIDYFPISSSGNGSVKSIKIAQGQYEIGKPWLFDLNPIIEENAQNPHFDLPTKLYQLADSFAKSGAIAIIFFNSTPQSNTPTFDPKYKGATLTIPSVYLNYHAYSIIKNQTPQWDISFNIAIEKLSRTAHNVIGYLDKKAPYTFIIGAHYDHLGRGEDGNSMIRTGSTDIHNGADDNASGTSSLISLASNFSKDNKFNAFNLLFIAFSGEELGLLGSRYFTENPTIDLTKATAMINMDMVGRLSDSSKSMTIGGFGTSSAWNPILEKLEKYGLQFKLDSSGTGPSDHTSFYRKDIPVLFFFTGLHTDYHKPTDDAEKINTYGMLLISKFIKSIINSTDSNNKLSFRKTREQQTSTSARFTVSMGIMPDYSYSGNGVRIDGVSEGRAAKKAGIQAGDILIQLGNVNISSVESYMQALSKYKKGESTEVIVLRNETQIKYQIVF